MFLNKNYDQKVLRMENHTWLWRLDCYEPKVTAI